MCRLNKFHFREAKRCESAKAYLAGCVMLGFALETLLTLMANLHPDEAEQTDKVPMKNGQSKPLLDSQFIESLGVAKAAQWLPFALDLQSDWSSRKTRIGDYAEVVR